MSDLITDEMVEAVARAEWTRTHEWPSRSWEKVPDDLADHYRECSRHALEAVAPLIAAKALRDFSEFVMGPSLHMLDGATCRSIALDAEALARRIERGES